MNTLLQLLYWGRDEVPGPQIMYKAKGTGLCPLLNPSVLSIIAIHFTN